ncbi:MAG: M23 family metallopeptidase [Candidatus Methylomirabilales bacterium]
MARRFYKIVLIPDASGRPRTLRIPAHLTRLASAACALALLGLGFLLYHYVALHAAVLRLQRERQDPVALRAARVQLLADGLAELDGLDRRLRVAAGLAPYQDSRIGRGGGRAGAEYAAAAAEDRARLVERLPDALQAVEQEITSRGQGLLELTRFVEARRRLLASTPAIWPVEGLVTDGYGRRRSPFSGGVETHEGLDIAAPLGTPVRASADGVAAFAGPLASFGNVVFLRHGHGFATLYAHLARGAVYTGRPVRRGQVIGAVGMTGRTTGPHLHYEVHLRGVPVNPLFYIVDAVDARRAVAAALRRREVAGEGAGARQAEHRRASLPG